jgi:hypothetical protein
MGYQAFMLGRIREAFYREANMEGHLCVHLVPARRGRVGRRADREARLGGRNRAHPAPGHDLMVGGRSAALRLEVPRTGHTPSRRGRRGGTLPRLSEQP